MSRSCKLKFIIEAIKENDSITVNVFGAISPVDFEHMIAILLLELYKRTPDIVLNGIEHFLNSIDPKSIKELEND